MPAGRSPRGAPGDVPDDAGARAAQGLGATLAAAREAAGQSVDDVAAVTRIRGSLIRSMEAGNFTPCGGDVYARGHLRSIAAALHADPAPLVGAYTRLGGGAGAAISVPTEPVAHSDPLALRDLSGRRGRRQGFGWMLAAVSALVVIALIAGVSLFTQGGNSSDTAQQVTPAGGPPTSSSAPPTAPTSGGPSGPSGAGTGGAGTGGASTGGSGGTIAGGSGAGAPAAGVNVTVQVSGSPSWVHVVDQSGALVFQGLLAAGQTKPFHATQELKFVFGFAPAIHVVVNGKQVAAPTSGASQVANVAYDKNGLISS